MLTFERDTRRHNSSQVCKHRRLECDSMMKYTAGRYRTGIAKHWWAREHSRRF